ncbi:hypothetical protein FNW52_15855 [Flavobacterium sp. ZT3R18]|uniref:hypothetical protein n=1 Tax=Flavobacterium sp. ZT3R18 TaxID=2594429 RepID=UPI001179CB27|nr:hypothetical protein [Flavobacterium sp. ZT3R18]TRX33232.1 hypothetical protein FNW52_15855 [Flavobacterium sp. ZT3R18]
MKLISKINTARMVKHISNDEFYYVNKDKQLVKYLNSKTENIISNIKCEVIEEWNSGLLINECIFYNYSTFEPLFEENNIYKCLVISNDKLIIKKNDFINEKIKFGVYNHKNNLILWIELNKNINPYFFNSNNTFISYTKLGLENYDLNLNLLWRHTFSSLLNEDEVVTSDEIVEVSDVIYFVLHGGGKHDCFALDANTGKVVKTYPDLVGQLIVEDETIYFLHTEIISILNTKTDEITTWFIDDLMKEKGVDSLLFPRWAVYDGLIYFSQSKGADRYSDNIGARFGVLDPIKKEMLWQHQLPLENGIIGEIKVNQNRIYLHTQDQTLFIFKRKDE